LRRRRLPEPNAELLRGGTTLARVRICRTPGEQLRGLIGYAPLPPGTGIALPGCAAIHTAFVVAPIDVLVLRSGRVAAIADGVQPWRAAWCRGADVTVELGSGSASSRGIRVGEALELREI
jgi:uncharacterized membrane protein (UPF0127 family)